MGLVLITCVLVPSRSFVRFSGCWCHPIALDSSFPQCEIKIRTKPFRLVTDTKLSSALPHDSGDTQPINYLCSSNRCQETRSVQVIYKSLFCKCTEYLTLYLFGLCHYKIRHQQMMSGVFSQHEFLNDKLFLEEERYRHRLLRPSYTSICRRGMT